MIPSYIVSTPQRACLYVLSCVLHSNTSGISQVGIISMEQMMEAQGRYMICMRQVPQLGSFSGSQVSCLQVPVLLVLLFKIKEKKINC